MLWMNFSDQLLCGKLQGGSFFFMRCVKPEIHCIQERKNINIITCYMEKRPDQRSSFFKKLPFSLEIFTNNIAELVVDNAFSEELSAKCFQLLFN